MTSSRPDQPAAPQPQKAYIGQRPGDDEIGDCRVYVQTVGSTIPLRHVEHHSPDGFEWGYGGSGPADLALSILADHFGERPTKYQIRHGDCRCWPLHQGFKWHFVAKLPHGEWKITTAEIAEWLAEQAQPDPDQPAE